MLKKLSRKLCLQRYPSFPQAWYDEKEDELMHSFPDTYGGCVLTVPSKSFRGHIGLVGKQLVSLFRRMQIDRLIFLGDSDQPWLAHKNPHPPVKSARDILSQNGIGQKFNGAIIVDLKTLPGFIRQVGWLTRGNSFSHFYFMDAEQRILASICQYGNIHLSILNEEANKPFDSALPDTLFKPLVNRTCRDSFSKKSNIPGRKASY